MAHRKRSNEARKRHEEHVQRQERQRQTRRLAIGIALILLVFVGLFYLANVSLLNPTGGSGVRVGQLAPDFALVDIDGRAFRLSDQRGHPVVLDFMGSNCPACVVEMPHLVETYSRYSGQGLVMISIDIGGSLGTEDPGEARGFLSTNGGTWPIALDNSGLAIRFQATSLPTIYVIDAAGVVAYRNLGGTSTVSALSSAIEPLL
ncbi:MAG: TlpA family protein disulfide reductase [Methanobacteriota archaeon]